MERLEAVCGKCGERIHREYILDEEGKNKEFAWLHNDYKRAWRVDGRGIAKALHFAEPERK